MPEIISRRMWLCPEKTKRLTELISGYGAIKTASMCANMRENMRERNVLKTQAWQSVTQTTGGLKTRRKTERRRPGGGRGTLKR